MLIFSAATVKQEEAVIILSKITPALNSLTAGQPNNKATDQKTAKKEIIKSEIVSNNEPSSPGEIIYSLIYKYK